MENKQFILKHSNKNGKDFYYLVLQFRYSSGKTYKQLVCFLTKEEYDLLADKKSLDILL